MYNLVALEKSNLELHSEVKELKTVVSNQKELIDRFELTSQASERGVSVEQEQLNCNIVIRGLDTTQQSSKEDLLNIYEGLRSHLQVSDESDLDPVELEVLPAHPGQDIIAKRPLIVKLKSFAAKKTLLQVRRQKKDIFPRDLALQQQSKRPLLITEQLTKTNQTLLYQARSLRGLDNYKFVWSSPSS